MKKNIAVITFLVLITSPFISVFAQPTNNEEAWKLSHREKRQQNINKVIEINDGNYLAVGYSSNLSEGGKDIIIMKLDKNGKILKTQTLGGRYDDECLSGKITNSGKIILCGYSKNKKLAQGILLITDTDLNSKLLYMDESKENSIFNDVEIDSDNNIFICGQEGNSLIIKKFTPDGKVIQQYNLDRSISVGNALKITRENELFCVGKVSNKKEFKGSSMLLMKFDLSLQDKGQWTFPRTDLFEGNDLIEDEFDDLVIAAGGKHNKRGGFAVPAIAVVSKSGEMRRIETFPSLLDGTAKSLDMAPSGDILVVGYGSDKRNAQRTALFSARVNPSNNFGKVWGPFFNGKDFDDEYNDVLCSSDGKILFSGYRGNGLNKDYYIYAIEPTRRDIENLTILKEIKILKVDNSALSKNTENSLKITLKNEANKDIKSFNINIECNHNKDGLIFPESLLVDWIRAGETKEILMPLIIKDDFNNDHIDLKLTIAGSDSKEYSTKRTEIKVLGTYGANIILDNNPVEADLTDRNKIEMPFTLHNVGDSPALIRDMDFSFNENVSLSEDFELPVDFIIQAGEEFKLNLICKVDSFFTDDAIVANIKIGELSGYRLESNETKLLNMRKIFSVVNNNIKDQNEPIVYVDEDHELSFTNIAETVRLIDRRSYRVNFYTNLPKYEISSKFKFFINGIEIPGDSIKTGYNQNTYSISVPLYTGNNELVLEGSANTRETIGNINVTNSNVNYYIYIIGTDLRDEDNMPVVKYCIKDVDDFYSKVKELGKSKKTKVNIKVFNTYSLTTSNNLKGVFNEILSQKHKFKPNDVMIIYWVGQGFSTARGDIYVKGSELLKNRKYKFTPENYSFPLTSIYIPECLGKLSCKKILLLDIYNKENVEENTKDDEDQDYDLVDKTIDAIKTFKNFSYILSGNLGQKSYELQNIQNGAFTYAVIQALEGNKGNLKDDNVLALSDFFENISKSIPDLVVKNGNKKWKQNPLYIKSRPEDDVVIFYK